MGAVAVACYHSTCYHVFILQMFGYIFGRASLC